MIKGFKKNLTKLLTGALAIAAGITVLVSAGGEAKAADGRKIDVWDFGEVQESNTALYNNNIETGYWKSNPNLQASGGALLEAKENVVGDLIWVNDKNDRLYMEGHPQSYGGAATLVDVTFGDSTYYPEYVAKGYWYCNGTGNSTKRYVTVKNCKVGDTLLFYMNINNGASSQWQFEYLGDDGTQIETVTYKTTKAIAFTCDFDGDYKFYETNNNGKPNFNRVMRIPAVNVSGNVDLGEVDVKTYGVKFKGKLSGKEFVAEVEDDSFKAALPPFDSYTAVMTGVSGAGFTEESRTIEVPVSKVIDGLKNRSLAVEKKASVVYSGKLVGFDDDYDTSDLKLTLIPEKGSNSMETEIFIDARMNFAATLDPSVKYTLKMDGCYDYEIASSKEFESPVSVKQDIEFTKKSVYQVTGNFLGLSEDAIVSSMKVTNLDDEYVYPVKVTADGYTASLRNGSYSVSAKVLGHTTITHIVVNGKDVKKDILFVAPAEKIKLDLVSDIYVGYKNKANNYDTVKEAVAAAAAMSPAKEADRITIHIAPGTYREQILINTPYISLVNDTDEEVLLTWYYGIGYKYYSIGTTGYFDEQKAFDKFEKTSCSARWGTCVYVQSKATGFRADGITFENSFNRYITEEEIEDGVESDYSTISFERKYGADVTLKAATERAAALCIEADKVEITNCTILSSQDSLYTGNANTREYFKNCKISGNTDYIFGDGSVIFDACELMWHGYATKADGGYITAMREDTGVTANGYLFRNCIVTDNPELVVSESYLGRPWGPTAKVAFINTKLQNPASIAAVGWKDMSGNTPEKANFKEFGTTNLQGVPVSTTDRVAGVIDAAEAAKFTTEKFFTDWKPASYSDEDAAVAFTSAPTVKDNGDINLPRPGHTLTVVYSLGEKNDKNDASLIQWFANGAPVYTTTAASTKDLKITSAMVGKTISVKVTPTTISGKQGEAQTFTLEAAVLEGYEEPGKANDVEIGEGINIYLAGDSTVKDYSANGMWTSGKNASEGAWGEYLGEFFDSSKVKVVNYAQGGRSSRTFYNEADKFQAIQSKIKKGDYLFIQFGHNDSSDTYTDRYTPLGSKDASGSYPYTEPTNAEKSNGTYKWYMKQYIDMAKAVGATPVLVTPVARTYFADGKIYPHHCVKEDQRVANTYCDAVDQLGKEQNVMVIDGYALTVKMYEDAFANDPKAIGDSSRYVQQVMANGNEKTHNNKLGGVVEAAIMAKEIQKAGLSISSYVKTPAMVQGENSEGKIQFTINAKSQITAWAEDASTGEFTVEAGYWQTYAQNIIDEIGNGISVNFYETKDDIDVNAPIFSVKTVAGKTIPTKTAPVREGYIFDGWYVADEKPFVFAGSEGATVINEATAVYAKWIAKEYVVSFHADAASDSAILCTTAAIHGGNIEADKLPQLEIADGNALKGWYDKDGNALVIASASEKNPTAIKGDVHFYPTVQKSDEIAYDVVLVNGDGKETKVTVKKGEKIAEASIPEISEKSGFDVVGWMEDGVDTAFDFTIAVNRDYKIVAKYSVHDLEKHEAVPASCKAPGVNAYWECKTCHKLFANSAGTKSIEAPAEIPADGHSFKLRNWKWSEDLSSAVATFVCMNCGENETVPGEVSAVVENATASANGNTNYTAVAVASDGTKATSTKVVAGGAIFYTIDDAVYTGEKVIPEIHVYYGSDTNNTELEEGVDYTVALKNNVAVTGKRGSKDYDEVAMANRPIATIKLKGNYEGTITTNFGIFEAEVDDVISIKGAKLGGLTDEYAYTGKPVIPEMTIDGEPVTKADFVIKASKNIKKGTATVVVIGRGGKYIGTTKGTFKIGCADINKVDGLEAISSGSAIAPYSKSGAKPVLNLMYNGVKLVEGVDYTLSLKNNKNISNVDESGKVTDAKAPEIIIKGKGNFAGATATYNFVVAKANLSTMNMTANDVALDTKPGKFISKVAVVEPGLKGKKLSEKKDYTLTYIACDANGNEIGNALTKADSIPADVSYIKATATAVEGGAFVGSKSVIYHVVPKDLMISKAKVVVADKTYCGAPVTLNNKDITITIGDKPVTFKILKDTYVKNTAKGTGKVTIQGTGEFGGTKTISFKILSQKLIRK